MWERGSTSVVLTFSPPALLCFSLYHIPSMHVYFNLIPHIFFLYLSLYFWDTKKAEKNCFNWYIAHVEFLIGHWINCLRVNERTLLGNMMLDYYSICSNKFPMSMMWVELNDWLLIIVHLCVCVHVAGLYERIMKIQIGK